ncbi:MAG: alcohol dehydrogenase catalytic domain-containing protein [Anaerolineae bacterium]|jgi:L-iditol 2-dehydrogenase|nr:alcohol dehydrogenase catalytic domain-containing protein [Anaerolineae bacterium]
MPRALEHPPTMRAVGLFGLRDLRMIEVAHPGAPGPGEVLLRVAAVGICGSDHHYYNEGSIGGAIVGEGMIMGHEFSAWVEAVGDGVKGLGIDQLVAVDPEIPCGTCESCVHGHPNLCPANLFCGSPNYQGSLAQYIRMPAGNCFILPEEVTPAEGALLEPLGVAIHAVDLAKVKVGETVAVLGVGSIGLLTAALSRASGAGAIYVSEPLAYRRDFAVRYLGGSRLPTEVFNPLSQSIVATILEATHGRGVDVAFEAAGASCTPDQAAQITRPGGRIVVVGIPSDDTMRMTASVVRRKGLTIRLVRRMKHTYPRAIQLVLSGAVDVAALATHVFPLENTGRAFEVVDRRSDGVIKAIVQVNEA